MFSAIKVAFVPTLKAFGNAVIIGAGAATGVGIARATFGWAGEKLTTISENTKVKKMEKKAGKAAQEVAAQAA